MIGILYELRAIRRGRVAEYEQLLGDGHTHVCESLELNDRADFFVYLHQYGIDHVNVHWTGLGGTMGGHVHVITRCDITTPLSSNMMNHGVKASALWDVTQLPRGFGYRMFAGASGDGHNPVDCLEIKKFYRRVQKAESHNSKWVRQFCRVFPAVTFEEGDDVFCKGCDHLKNNCGMTAGLVWCSLGAPAFPADASKCPDYKTCEGLYSW